MSKFPYELIDLTHALDASTPTWDGSCGFNHCIGHDYDPSAEFQFRTHKITMNEGIGTHMDSPAHCFPSGATIDQLSLSELVAPCVVIDISAQAHERYSLSPQDIKNFEDQYGPIPANAFVMVKTGWERFWNEPTKYRNNLLFPSISAQAAQLLLEKGACGIGIDTLSPDRQEDGFPVHKAFLGAGKYIVENAANLETLPAREGFIMVVPMKIRGGTEAPVRLIGLKKGPRFP